VSLTRQRKSLLQEPRHVVAIATNCCFVREERDEPASGRTHRVYHAKPDPLPAVGASQHVVAPGEYARRQANYAGVAMPGSYSGFSYYQE